MLSCGREMADLDESINNYPILAEMSPLRQELTAGTYEDYMNLWGGLTADEKYGVWIEKMEETKMLSGWSSAQLDKLDFFQEVLSPSVFESAFTFEEDSLLRIEAEEVFSAAQVYQIFGNVYPYDGAYYGPVAGGGTAGQDPDCTCYWSWSCGGSNSCITSTTCVEVVKCGFWGNSNCKGKCEQPIG